VQRCLTNLKDAKLVKIERGKAIATSEGKKVVDGLDTTSAKTDTE
jgi:DNA-binding transcriptional regulator YhcF (GntR family)